MQIKKIGLTFDDLLLIPKKSSIHSRADVNLQTNLTPKIKLQIPIISANMDTVTESAMATALSLSGGIGIIHRFLTIDRQVAEVKKVKKNGGLVGAAVGVKPDYLERTRKLIQAGCDTIVIDIAHGHSLSLIKTLSTLKKTFPKTEFIAGNIATSAACRDLINAGTSAVKVGIGPGALCTTRIVAGVGVPQITATLEVTAVAKKYKIPVIADGGIRSSGDIVKALAAGASSVMLGTFFAGCSESPALTFFRDGEKFKLTRGMASLTASHDRQRNGETIGRDLKEYTAEGVEAIVRYKGNVADVLTQLVGGVKSGFSYCGAKNIKELWQKAEFMQISQNGLIESHPHDVRLL